MAFRKTGNSETPIVANDLQPADSEDLHEKLIAQAPQSGTERIAVVVESYEDKFTGAVQKPFAPRPIALKLSIKP